MFNASIRQRLATAFVIVATLASGYYALFVHPDKNLTREDGVAKWEARMKPVRASLPLTVHEVGYISDNDPTAILQEYVLTRFALAPILVRQSTNYEWIVGNFTQPGFEHIIRQNISSAYTIQKFGSGIYLIHRTLP